MDVTLRWEAIILLCENLQFGASLHLLYEKLYFTPGRLLFVGLDWVWVDEMDPRTTRSDPVHYAAGGITQFDITEVSSWHTLRSAIIHRFFDVIVVTSDSFVNPVNVLFVCLFDCLLLVLIVFICLLSFDE